MVMAVVSQRRKTSLNEGGARLYAGEKDVHVCVGHQHATADVNIGGMMKSALKEV